jgi:hypothetical protein
MQESSSEGSNCRCTSTSGDFVRWESSSEGYLPLDELSSEGSDYRCKFHSNFDYDFDSIYAIIFPHGLRSS